MSGKTFIGIFLCFVAGYVEGSDHYIKDDLKHIFDELKILKEELKQVHKQVNNLEKENEVLLMKSIDLEDKNHDLERKYDKLAEETQTTKENVVQEGDIRIDHRLKHGKRDLTPVGFTAVLDHDVVLGPNQAILFDKIVTNIGASYNARDGMFTAPITGLYMFSKTICSQANSAVHVELVKNGVQLAAIYGDDYDLGTQNVMVQMNENDKVWVRHFIDSGPGNINNESNRHYTTFSGVLILAL